MKGWHYRLCLITSPNKGERTLSQACLYISFFLFLLKYTSWHLHELKEADLMCSPFYKLTVYQVCFPSHVGSKKNEMILTFPFFLPSLFSLFPSWLPSVGTADWQPLLSLRVTVVEISLRGSKQISAGDVDKRWQSWGLDGERRKENIYFYMVSFFF